MHKFKVTTIGAAEVELIQGNDATKVLKSLSSRPNWDALQVLPDVEPGLDGHWQFPRLSASWLEGRGYEVQYYESAQSDSDFLVTSPDLSEPEVYIDLGGQTQELWPRQLFVPFELAENALMFFLQNGGEDPALHWIDIGAFPRRTVGPRRTS